MKVATFNVNSIRKRLPVVKRWLKTHAPDVLCLQETKVQDSEFPAKEFAATGYHVRFCGMKGEHAGWPSSRGVNPSGSRMGWARAPAGTGRDCCTPWWTAFPSSTRISRRASGSTIPSINTKLEWFKRLRRYFTRHLSPDEPAIWCGDMNVAPEPIDVHHPEKHFTHVCFHYEARLAYRRVVEWGFEDLFRRLYPDRQQFTFWDYRQPDALKANRGWARGPRPGDRVIGPALYGRRSRYQAPTGENPVGSYRALGGVFLVKNRYADLTRAPFVGSIGGETFCREQRSLFPTCGSVVASWCGERFQVG